MVIILKILKIIGLSKIIIDVMGICCFNEVFFIKKLLEFIFGVEEVFVNVIFKIVIVLYD